MATEGGIFIDILTRLNIASVDRVLKEVKTIMREAGGESGKAFSEAFDLDGAAAKFKELTTASQMAYRDMQTGLAELQLAEARINSLRAQSFAATSEAMIAAQKQVDASIANTQKLIEAANAKAAEQRAEMALAAGGRVGGAGERGEGPGGRERPDRFGGESEGRGEGRGRGGESAPRFFNAELKGRKEKGENRGADASQEVGTDLLGERLGRHIERGISATGRVAGIGGALGTAAFFGTGLRTAVGVQTNMQEVAARHQDPTHNAGYIAQQTQGIYQLARDVPYSPQQLASVYKDIENQGFTGKAALDVLKTSAQTATATNGELKQTTEGLMTSLRDFGTQMELSSTNSETYTKGLSDLNQQAGQLIITLGNLKGVKPDELFGALGNVEPTAMEYMNNMSGPAASAQVMSALAMLAKVGINPDQASHNVSRIIGQLGSVPAGGKLFNMLGQLGVKPESIVNQMQSGGIFPTLQTINSAIKSKTDDQGMVDIGWQYDNEQVNDLIQQNLSGLGKGARAFVEGHPQIEEGLATRFSLRKDMDKSIQAKQMTPEEAQDITTLTQWESMTKGPNKNIKQGAPTKLTPGQVFQIMAGTGDIARTMAILGANPDEGQGLANKLTGTGGDALKKGFDEMMKTMPKEWQQLKSNLQALSGELSEHVLPTLVGWVKSLNDFIDHHKTASKVLLDAMIGAAAVWLALKTHIPQGIFKGGKFAYENLKPNYQGGYGPPTPLKETETVNGTAAADEISGAGAKAGSAMGASITEGGAKAAETMGGAVTEGGVKAGESMAASLTAATAKVSESVSAGVASGATRAGEAIGTSITGAGSRAAEEMGAAITTAGATAAAEMRSGMPVMPGGVVPSGGGEPSSGGKRSRLGGFLGFAGRFAPEAFLANSAGDELKQYQQQHPGQWNPALGQEPPQLQQFLKDQGYSRGGIAGYASGTGKVADPYSQPLMGQPDMKRDSLLGTLPGGQSVGLRGGEGILTPEAVQSIGGKNAIDAINGGENPWSDPMKVGTTFYKSFSDGVAKYSPFGKYLKASSQTLDDLEKEFNQTTKLHEADAGEEHKARKLTGVPSDIQQMLAAGMSPAQIMEELGTHPGKRGGLQMGSGGYLSNKERAMLGLPEATKGGKASWFSNEDTVHSVFSKYFPESEWSAYRNLEMHEAGFDPHAQNPKSSAYGIGQFLDQTWGQYGSSSKTSDLTTQAEDQMKYIRGRYGSPNSAWGQYFDHPGGEGSYARGGIVGYADGGNLPRPARDDKRGGPFPGGGPGGNLPSNGRDGSWPDWWRKSINEHFDDIPEWMPQWGMNGPNDPAIIGGPNMHPSHLPGKNGIGGFSTGGVVGYDIGGVVGGLKGFSGQSSDDDLINYHGHWVKRPQSLGDWSALSDFYHNNKDGIQNNDGAFAWEKNDPSLPPDDTVGGMKSAVGIGDDPTIPGMRQVLKGVGHAPWPGYSTGGVVGFAGGGVPLAPAPAPAPPGPAPGPVAPGGSATPPPNITSQAQSAGIAPTDNPQGPTPPPNISDAARAAGIAPTDQPAKPPAPGTPPKQQPPGKPAQPDRGDKPHAAKVLTPQGDKPGAAAAPEGDRNVDKNPSRQGGQENTSKGFGLGGGLVGFAESLPGMALSAAGGAGDAAGGMGGASAAAAAGNAAMQIGFSEANRAIGYGGQLLGILGSGLLETFLPNDSQTADPTNSLFGKVALGIAGAHPSPKNLAGSSAMQMKPKEDLDAGASASKQVMPMVHMDHPTINNHTGDHQETGNAIMKAAFGLPVGGQP